MRWRRSTREGSIYRTKRARANLTYLFAASVKSEGAQVDMVTVRTVIKGLRRWFDRKRSWFWRYFTVQDLLVGPSAVPSNGNIVDGRIKWRDSVRKVEEFEEYARKSGRSCSDFWRMVTKLGELIVERHHYCREFRSINDFYTPKLGGMCWHRFWTSIRGSVKYRSAGWAMVTSLQGSCRWGWLPTRRQLNMTKSRRGDVFMPMISIGVCRWP